MGWRPADGVRLAEVHHRYVAVAGIERVASNPEGRLAVGRLVVGQSAVGQPAVGQLAVGRLAVGRLAVGRVVEHQVVARALDLLQVDPKWSHW